jgi:Carboxypeptidase regulatory-like domain
MRQTIVAFIVSTAALAVRAQTASIAGRVVADATGDPILNRVALTIAATGSPVPTDGDGRIALPAPAGRVSVIASKSGYARSEPAPATAGQPIEIRLRRGATILGRVVDRFGDSVAAARVAAQTAWAGSTNATTVATVETDDRGEYRLAGLSGEKVIVSELVGTITDDNARPVPGAHVVVFPTNRDRWYPGSRFLRTAVTDADGVFAVTGLPFGIYYAAAVARLPAEGADAWQDRDYLESLVARGRTFTMGGDGDKVAINLRISAR